MKSIVLSFLLLLNVEAFASDGFQLRQYETQTLKNGLMILWVADPGLPYVTIEMMIRGGSAQDPLAKAGVANFTAAMLNKGTKNRSAAQISEDLEQIGSGFATNVEPDFTTLSTSGLSFNKDAVLKMFAEIVLQPSFTNAELERLRKQFLGGLQKMADHADEFVSFLLPGYLYGKHPYGHEAVGSIKAIKGIRRVDLQKFYSSVYTPENAVIAVIGQYDDTFKESLVKTFELWKGKAVAPNSIPNFPEWKGREVLLVDRGDLNQAQIQIGFKGVARNIPDYMELRAALKVLGESFGSRLFDEIREKRGLTYHINSWFDPRLQTGPMGIYTFTRVDKIGETINESLKVFEQFVKDGITEAEMDNVKALMRGQFPRSFETPEALGTQLLILNRYGISSEYLTHYLDNVQLLTKEKVNATIKKYFNPENLRLVVYAPRAKAEESLKKIGKVEVKSYKEFLQ